MFLICLFLTLVGIVQTDDQNKRLRDIMEGHQDRPVTTFIFNTTWQCSLNSKWSARVYFYDYDFICSNDPVQDYKINEYTAENVRFVYKGKQEGDGASNTYDIRVIVFHNCRMDKGWMNYFEKIGEADSRIDQNVTMYNHLNLDNKGEQMKKENIPETYDLVKFKFLQR